MCAWWEIEDLTNCVVGDWATVRELFHVPFGFPSPASIYVHVHVTVYHLSLRAIHGLGRYGSQFIHVRTHTRTCTYTCTHLLCVCCMVYGYTINTFWWLCQFWSFQLFTLLRPFTFFLLCTWRNQESYTVNEQLYLTCNKVSLSDSLPPSSSQHSLASLFIPSKTHLWCSSKLHTWRGQ